MYKIFANYYDDFTNVVEQCKQLAEQHDLYTYGLARIAQLSIQTEKNNLDNWTISIGKPKHASLEWEKSFDTLQPSLTGTPIDRYLQSLSVKVYRTRLMVARPKSCYSIHYDMTPRLHLPLVTNEQCNFLFLDPMTLAHLPAQGRTYWVDTRLQHTFLNGSDKDRLHLVMVVEN
jgi:hypothetical protein